MPLNNDQGHEMERDLTLDSFLDEEESIAVYDSYYPFKRAVTSFKGHCTEFTVESKKKNKSKAGTVSKTSLKKELAKDFGLCLSLTKDYAIIKNDVALETLVDFSVYKIYRMKGINILSFITNKVETVFTTALYADADFIKYEVTKLKVDAIVAKAIDYNSKIGKTTQTGNTSSTANTQIDKIIDLIHLDVESMENTINVFADEHPGFIDGFNKNKVIYKTGVHHQGVQGKVYKNNVLAPEAFLRIVDTDKTTTSDAEAIYKIIYMKVGHYTIECKNASGDYTKVEFDVTPRNITNLDIHLD